MKIGTTKVVEFVTSRFDTGNLSNADSTPLGTIAKNGVDNVLPVTISNIAVGRYSASFTPTSISGFSYGDSVSLYISATVNSVSGGNIIYNDIIETYLPTDVANSLGTPVALDGGSATISSMLTKLVDDNGGSNYDATFDSLHAAYSLNAKAAILGTPTSGTIAQDIKNISSTIVQGQPSTNLAITGNVVNANEITGSYLSTFLINGVYWNVRPVGGNPLDINLTFSVGSSSLSTIYIAGRYTAAANRFVDIYAWNYITNAYELITSSLNRLNHSTSDNIYEIPLLSQHKNVSGTVKIRFLSDTGTATYNLFLDVVWVKTMVAGVSISQIADAIYAKMYPLNYDNGVWIDTVYGISGSDIGINGISTNPCLYYSDALTIANALNLKRFYFKPDSTITLTQNHDNWRFIGRGKINLNGQSINDDVFEQAELISGTSTGTDAIFIDCEIGTTTIDSCCLRDCLLKGTLTTVISGNYVIQNCFDGIPGESNPTLVCKPSGQYGIRNWSGGINLDSISATNMFIIDGRGKLILNSNCTGGEIRCRGNFDITDNVVGGFTGTFTKTANINTSTPLTLSSAYTTSGATQVSVNTLTTNVTSVSGDVVTIKNQANKLTFDSNNRVYSDVAIISAGTIGADQFTQGAADKVWLSTSRALTDKLNFAISGTKQTLDSLNDITAASVWSVVSRSLTDKAGFALSGSKQTLDALNDITVANVWLNATRSLTDKTNFSISGTKQTLDALNDITVANVWLNATRSLTDKAGFTISGSKQTLDSLQDVSLLNIWNYATRTLTDKTGFALSGAKQTLDALNDITAASVWLVATRALTDKLGFSISGTKQTLDDLNDISTAQVRTQANNALIGFDSGQGVAKEASVLSIQNNTRFVTSIPAYMFIPVDTASEVYKFVANFYTVSGTSVDPDNNDLAITINTVGAVSKDSYLFSDINCTQALSASVNFPAYKALTKTGIGKYEGYYQSVSGVSPDQLMIDFALKEATIPFYYSRTTLIITEQLDAVNLSDSTVNKDIIAKAMKTQNISGTDAVAGSIYEDVLENITTSTQTITGGAFNPATYTVDGVTYDYIMQLNAAMVNGNFSYNAGTKVLTFFKRNGTTPLTTISIPDSITRTRLT